MKALAATWALAIVAPLLPAALAAAHKRTHHGHKQAGKTNTHVVAEASSDASVQVVADYSMMRAGTKITESAPVQPKSCESIPGWFHGKPVFEDAVESFRDGLFVEIGPYLGKSSCEMVKLIEESGKPIDFHVVDSWDESSMPGWAPREHMMLVKQHGGTLQSAFLHFMTETQTFAGIQKMIRGNDREKQTADNFKDNSVSFLYVDTEHGYEKTTEMLELWFRKVRVGGRMCGDELSDRGTHMALSRFFRPQGLGIEDQRGDQWCVTASQPYRQAKNTIMGSVLQMDDEDESDDEEADNSDDEVIRRGH
mmetsp:Transcript_95482/g.169536  ORF Transcript_95482/g.169536 Transcript_95482/m.169536 type:complete len:309 (-) Transcript_95482:95-1021(-)|eukprot:CAMPEP_0197647468 /NCGR_PEP_ID=MMETSP1338-20131121/25453_1 /TAXON_ID=43686 ORGANISM="Pelagodinium beii, Strain RCC1491" /NCGR_SAMPLE_ID=MMETSP1338 /ASSEMBLY_ACC=CAM_ASM_000754 /LENGTH=308 /DNA_ID=CAMNT_0043221271 /DNA_START=85 /DNA_END=1011 /DNA_ORIENTATION=+